MPKNNIMFSNFVALHEGHKRVQNKQIWTLTYFQNVNYVNNISKFAFDFRDMNSIIPLMISLEPVADQSEEKQKEYYLSELKKIEEAFVFSQGKEPGMPDPEKIKPYLKKMYDTIATHHDIDWDNAQQIENLFDSMLTTQAIGTMVEKFAPEIIEIYPTLKDSKKVDMISAKSYLNYRQLQGKVRELDPDLLRGIYLGAANIESHYNDIEQHFNELLFEATDKGEDSVTLDPDKSELITMFFSKKSFAIQDKGGDEDMAPGIYNSDKAAKEFLEALSKPYSKGVIEYISVREMDEEGKYTNLDLLLINGRSAQELVNETMMTKNVDKENAKLEVGKMISKAMTDGKSIVSLMRPSINAEGKVTFRHQEIKVDLDKLNEARRERCNWFRRQLDSIGIWKIAKFVSNATRDEAQAKYRSSEEYQNAITANEDHYIDVYHQQVENEKKNCRLFSTFKNITKAEKVDNEPELNNQELGNEHELNNELLLDNQKVRLPIILESEDEDLEIEPMKEESPKSLDRSGLEP